MCRTGRTLVIASLLSRCAAAADLDPGDFYFTYPSGRPLMTVKCRPSQWLDGRFYLSEGDPSMFLFAFHNPSGENPTDPHLMLALPESVRVVGQHDALKLARSTPWEASRVLYDFRLPRSASAYASDKDAASSRGLALLVMTQAKSGTTLPDAQFWFRDGKRAGLRSVLELKVLPPIRSRTPRDFRVGVMLRKPTFYLRGEKVGQEFGAFVKRCGIGWVNGSLRRI